MTNLIEILLQAIYKKKDAAERIVSELETVTQDDLLIRFFEGKTEAYQEIIDMLTTKQSNERT
jgi:hypothetical protein